MKLQNLHKKTNKWVTRSAALLATVSLLATASVPLVAYAQDVYTVQAGDNLYRIAMDNGTTEDYLMAINGLSSNLLQIGQEIILPSGDWSDDGYYETPSDTTSDDGVYTVRAGDNLYNIAVTYGTTEEALMAINGLSTNLLQIGQKIVLYGDTAYTPTPNEPVSNGVHVVVAGDNLWDLAQRYGTTEAQLMAWNGMSSNFLNIGDRIAVYGPADDSSWTAPTEDTSDSGTVTNDGIYTVVAGDNLWDIAQWFGTTEEQLMAWNGMSSNFLNIGDRISVYGPSSNAYVPESSTSESTWTPPQTDGNYYTVQQGDNLWDIAQWYGTTEEYLMSINGLSSNLLQIGQQILVVAPTTDSVETAPTTETTEVNSNLRKAELPRLHKVLEGDDIASVAKEYDIKEEQLLEWNELTADSTLAEGDELNVTNPNIEPKIHVFAEGDTLDSIATEYNTLVENLRNWNQLEETDELVVGDEVIVTDPTANSYTVTPGETLNEIAQTFEVTVENLRAWNELPAEAVLVNGTIYISAPTGPTAEELAEKEAATEEATTEETSEESSEEASE